MLNGIFNLKRREYLIRNCSCNYGTEKCYNLYFGKVVFGYAVTFVLFLLHLVDWAAGRERERVFLIKDKKPWWWVGRKF